MTLVPAALTRVSENPASCHVMLFPLVLRVLVLALSNLVFTVDFLPEETVGFFRVVELCRTW